MDLEAKKYLDKFFKDKCTRKQQEDIITHLLLQQSLLTIKERIYDICEKYNIEYIITEDYTLLIHNKKIYGKNKNLSGRQYLKKLYEDKYHEELII